jgi:hypothetical protein
MTHVRLAESLHLPLEGGRYVDGFLNLTGEGRLVFEATSGTFPAAGADAANAPDRIRGIGVPVAQ